MLTVKLCDILGQTVLSLMSLRFLRLSVCCRQGGKRAWSSSFTNGSPHHLPSPEWSAEIDVSRYSASSVVPESLPAPGTAPLPPIVSPAVLISPSSLNAIQSHCHWFNRQASCNVLSLKRVAVIRNTSRMMAVQKEIQIY